MSDPLPPTRRAPMTTAEVGVLWTLAFVGGFADAGSYVLAGSFTGHLTGNTVLSAVHLVRGEWADAGRCLLAVAAFFTGTLVGGRCHAGKVTGTAGVRQLWLPLSVEVALFGLSLTARATLPPPAGGTALIAGLCLALGLQNGALQRLDLLSVHTTYVTGLATTFAATLGAGAAGRPKRNELAGVIGSFTAGAVVGGALAAGHGVGGFAIILIPAVAALLVCMSTGRSNLEGRLT